MYIYSQKFYRICPRFQSYQTFLEEIYSIFLQARLFQYNWNIVYDYEMVKRTKWTCTFTPKSFTGFAPGFKFWIKFTYSFCKLDYFSTMEIECTIMKWSSLQNKLVHLLPKVLQDLPRHQSYQYILSKFTHSFS